MNVAIVHDDLVQWGGAERVLEGICELFPDAPIYTSVYDLKNDELRNRFKNKKVITSFLQKIPGWRSLYKALLPLYPIAFEQFDFFGYDLVISHTTRFAKSIITKPKTKHICYCHTPPRFLWNLSGEKSSLWLEPLLSYLRVYDVVSANRVDHFIAGSYNAKSRIKKVYHQEAAVVHPFVDLERFLNIESFQGGYVLSIARLNKYKRLDLVIKACIKAKINLKIIGAGPDEERLKLISQEMNKVSEVEFLGNVSEDVLVRVLAGAKALVISGIEDFGLTSIEAQALGKPVIAYKNGGVNETVIEGKSGLFFDEQNVKSLYKILNNIDDYNFNPKDCIENAHRFSKEIFKSNFMKIINDLIKERSNW